MVENYHWIPSTNKYGVAICNYQGSGGHCLPLCVGETVHILEQYGVGRTAWFRGTTYRNKDKLGIFPACIIHIKPCKVENEGFYETVTSTEDQMVCEVADVLWEWSATWKHIVNSTRQSQLLRMKIFHNVEELTILRSELLNWRHTRADLADMKRDIVGIIDWGNGKLGMDLVPRINGEQVDVDRTSIVQLYRVHVNSAEIAQDDKPKSRARKSTKSSKGETIAELGNISHHLLVSFKNFGCNVGDPTETMLSLYQYKDNKLVCLTEQFMVKYTKLGMPEDADKVDNYFGLFTDLTSDELEKELYLVAHIYRIGKMLQENTRRGCKNCFKRPWGVGVVSFNISKLPSGFKEWEYQIKVQNFADTSSENHFINYHELLISKLQAGNANNSLPTSQAASSKLGLTLTVSVQVLHGDLASIKKENPLLFGRGVAHIQKIGFSDVISPGEIRNDFYVTLRKADLERGNKTSGKNVEVNVTVLSESGDLIENCIEYGCGEPMQSEYNSSVFYHSNHPEWTETIRLCIPIETFPRCHVCFTLYHCSVSHSKKEKREPYGFAFFRVTNSSQIVIKDGIHSLCVYPINEKQRSDMRSFDKTKYFKNPFLLDDLNDPKPINLIPRNIQFKANERESLTVETLLCSGKFTQNGHLPSILNWRGQEFRPRLSENLEVLCTIEGAEIVKFLHDILDALFDMMMDEDAKKDCSAQIFRALIYIFTLIHHERFKMFKPVLESYVTDTFSALLVHEPLCRCFKDLIEDACKLPSKQNLQLIQSFEVMDFIFHFIVRSRKLQEKNKFSSGSQDAKLFRDNLHDFFVAIGNLLALSHNSIQCYQLNILSHLHLMYDPLLEVLGDGELAGLINLALQHMPPVNALPDEITKVKLELLRRTVATRLFSCDESRNVLVGLCMVEVQSCLQVKHQTCLAIQLLSDVMDHIFSLHQSFHSNRLIDVGEVKIEEDIQSLVESMFDVIMNTILQLSTQPHAMGALIACLLELLRLMENEHYEALLHILHRGQDLRDFLMHILGVFRVLVNPDIFPKDWAVMRMVTNHVIFNSMAYFSNALTDKFLTEERFNTEVWNVYFNLAVSFITQPGLQLDQYSHAKAEKFRDRYQDMRVLMGIQVESQWNSLGIHRANFIPDLVGPFLRLTLVPEQEVRKVTLPIIVDMLEWDQRQHGNFEQVEGALIERLDELLTQQHSGDENYKNLFHQILLERVQSEPNLQENGPQFVLSVTHLLERLLDYRQVVDGDENKDKRMHCTFNILNFYRDEIKREEMYIRYVNKLHELHMVANNHAEAGLTLQLYAKVLHWSDNILPAEMNYREQREQDRKEMLYMQIINSFDRGKVWEYALPLCKDLAEYYERNFSYKKLGDILKQQACFYQKILEGSPSEDPDSTDTFYPRVDPAYYRVAYYGQSFPAFVRNKQFIYRGDECLKLDTIKNHLTAEFPQATIMSHNNPLSEAYKDGHQQYIQICSLKPVPGQRTEFLGKNVPQEIRNFYTSNEVDTFQFDRPYHRGEKDKINESKTLCIERTKMKTAYKFPGILRWYEVIEIEVEMLCPIRVAIETLKTYNSELSLLIDRCQGNPKLFFPQLEMRLKGMISANVMGGIAKYHQAFFTEEFERDHPDEAVYLDQLKQLLHEQVHVLAPGMQMHEKHVPPNLMPLHKNLETEFEEMKRTVAQHGSLYTSQTSLVEQDTNRGSGSSSGRSSLFSDDELSLTNSQDVPFNFAPSERCRRSYVPFPEECSLGMGPPPVPQRPLSMLLPHERSGLDKKMGSDPSFQGHKTESHMRGSISTGHMHSKVQRTSSAISTKTTPAVPERQRKFSDEPISAVPAIPTTFHGSLGRTEKIPEESYEDSGKPTLPPKKTKSSMSLKKDQTQAYPKISGTDLPTSPLADGPDIPPLPPRQGSISSDTIGLRSPDHATSMSRPPDLTISTGTRPTFDLTSPQQSPPAQAVTTRHRGPLAPQRPPSNHSPGAGKNRNFRENDDKLTSPSTAPPIPSRLGSNVPRIPSPRPRINQSLAVPKKSDDHSTNL
ncbi:dedicator of cytokinesis protein 4-like isoform X2 [Mya arenaria]|uniref:dedicator of cytokinesis protein 4-like isoform X2 n=1 Tax=Mya arenaria TaxID=6604 RepID=UPI0022E00F58|nr:dedicator of cytokinesis protein 4-like isoform X2 [Mya arenaria]